MLSKKMLGTDAIRMGWQFNMGVKYIRRVPIDW
jgi:hypothetical protein